jgi:type IV secretion system protein VirB10
MANQPSTSLDVSTPPARVTDRRRLPPGVVPRHLQQWVLVGTAVVMVGILALSGPPAKPRATTTLSPAAVAVDPNQQRIEDYERRIQEQAQRLAAEQAQLQLTKEAFAGNAGETIASAPRRPLADGPASTTSTPLKRDTHEDQARFADNVAFSRTGKTGVADTVLPASAPGVDVPMAFPTPPSLGVPPLPAGLPGLPGGAAVAPTLATLAAFAPTPASRVASASTGPSEPRYVLFEGSFIETVLTNRLDGTFSGPVNCLVSVPVYASDHLVIPAGARVLGEARAVNTFGQSRLAVTFHRVILPNGAHVSLDQFHGLNQVGDLGLRDQVDRHYAQIFGVSLALGAIAGFAQGQSAVGFDATAIDTYRQGAAASVSQSSAHVLDRFLNQLPTVTIREGHRIKVVLSQDLELPAYQPAFLSSGGRP